MEHPVLGILKSDEGTDFLVATISYGGRELEVCIAPDGQPLEEVLRLVTDVVQRLDQLEALAKLAAVPELLETYNTAWREFDILQEDGTLVSISEPELSAEEFKEALTLKAINVTGTECVDLFFDDDELFDGHSVVAACHEGGKFEKVYVSLYG